jgi:hypothetical protein
MRKLRVLLLAGIPMAAWSQTLVEYGLGAAAAGTAGAAAGGSGGSAIAGVFANLTKTLNATASQAAANGSTTAQPAKAGTARVKTAAASPAAASPAAAAEIAPADAPAPPKPVVVFEDPAGIKTGMEQAELLSRFGEPMMKVTTGQDAASLTYDGKDRVFDVEIRDGKVYSVQAKNKPRQASVMLLQ